MAEKQEIIFRVGGINNKQDPLRLGRIATDKEPVVDAMTIAENVDVDNNNIAKLRAGRIKRMSGVPHSFWTDPRDNTRGFFVDASVLKRLHTDYTSTALATLQGNAEASYEVINGETVFTNGTDIGWIDGTGFVPFALPDVVDRFEALMPAGQFVAFDYGDACLLVAKDDIIYKSKPYSPELYDTRLGMLPMNGMIRMLGTVEDGWWIATEKHVSFIQRSSESDYTFTHVSDNAPAKGVFVCGWEDTENGRKRFVAWASVDGVCVGRAGGTFQKVSGPGVALPTGTSGRLIYRTRNGITQFIVVIRKPVGAEDYTAANPTVSTLSI